ncbi:protein phosphatase 2C domain-containing protein [Aestuariirhabdus sp. Z084]|uniref:PP2C family protein-serine/threonine phosphatase n=1 Tax=Aestuariirhabdus haliotis TaxID=2918751 RepID=UPI00201B45AA|nr:PP2C family serine/threonine-protein phosphatase [Aestuariirhabdus haliotis]MCL6417550.1 protein phosphatase 2C domain-containing protein [Aestuariirhabdus haliotis]MCL6421495.1 protein phosphatase 2C domain-containing protein [Aestuariirhabdus haliotis]
MATISFAARTDPGKQRSNNEDCFLCDESLGLWLVADGMGGHNCGEVASKIAVDTLAREVANERPLTDAIHRAHEAIREQSQHNKEQEGMGTTLVGVKDQGTHYDIGWVGDSRIYRWNPVRVPPMQQLSRDHSYVQELLESGAINQQEADNHPQRNIITQSLGCPLDALRVDTDTLEWLTGDTLLLCSDGLSDELSDEEMQSLIEQPVSCDQLADDLIEAALSRGGRDNISLVVIRAEADKPPSTPSTDAYQRQAPKLIVALLALLAMFYLSLGGE